MTKRQKKPKAGHQKPKQRKKVGGGGGSASSSKGTMTGLRSVFKKTARQVAGAGAKKKATLVGRIIDVAWWLVAAGVVVYLISGTKCIW